MADRQVLLQGGNWKVHFLFCVLVILVGLLILHLWSPGTISSFLAAVYDYLASLYSYVGSLIDYLQERF